MSSLAPVSFRVSTAERELLEAAAEQARTTLSDFIRRRAVEAAELELVQRNRVVIPAAAWKKFESWASRPPRKIRGLRELAAAPPAWRD